MIIVTRTIVFIGLLGLLWPALGPGQQRTAIAYAGDSDLSLGVGIRKSTGKSDASLYGTFIMVEYGTEAQPWASRIKLTFYGNGSGRYQVLDDSSGYTDSGSFTYSVASDGRVSVPGLGLVGVVSNDGNMFALVDAISADKDLSLKIGVKQPSGMSNASLNGIFIMGEYGTEAHPWTTRAQLTFLGNGTGTFQVLHDSEGDTGTGSFYYSVTSDGKLSAGGSGIEEVGIVNAAGNVFTLVDADGADNELSIKTGIKQPSGMSAASLNGTFIFVEYGTDPNPRSGRLELTFDGRGNGTFVAIDDSNGQTDNGSFTYSVTSDGKLSIPGQGLIGVVNAAGNMFMLVDSNESTCVTPFLQLLLNSG